MQFYRDLPGLTVQGKQHRTCLLGTGDNPYLLGLTEVSGDRTSQTTGLYHFAILLSQRWQLGQLLKHLLDSDYPLQGASDHLVSEAVYFADPDGNGIEVYADRPTSLWSRDNGKVHMAAGPLDMDAFLEETDATQQNWRGLPHDAGIGHIHLRVNDLVAAERFYREILGFNLTARYGDSAPFLAAGGYHHHIGLNTWGGPHVSAPAMTAPGLEFFTILLPNSAALQSLLGQLNEAEIPYTRKHENIHLQDPTGNHLIVTVEPLGKLTEAPERAFSLPHETGK